MKTMSQPSDLAEESLAEGLRELLQNAEGQRISMNQFFDSFREKGLPGFY